MDRAKLSATLGQASALVGLAVLEISGKSLNIPDGYCESLKDRLRHIERALRVESESWPTTCPDHKKKVNPRTGLCADCQDDALEAWA